MIVCRMTLVHLKLLIIRHESKNTTKLLPIIPQMLTDFQSSVLTTTTTTPV